MPTTTPNMDLTIPDIGESGPTWSEQINDDLSAIDSHDHSPGHGAPISRSSIAGLGTMAEQDAGAVAITGGSIAVSADPTTNLQVATKQYVDGHAGTGITSLTGDVVATGPGAASAGLVNIPANTPAIFLRFTGIGGPGTPSAGKGNAYYDQTGKVLALVNDAGVVTHTVKSKPESTHVFLTGIDDDGTVHGTSVQAEDIGNASAAGITLLKAADAAAQRTDLGLGPLATASSMTVVGDLYGNSTGTTLTAHVAANAVTYDKIQQASANTLLGHGPGGFVPLATLSTPIPAGTTPRYLGVGDNTTTTSTRSYIPAACTITFMEIAPQSGGAPTVDTVFTVYKNGVATACTLTQTASNTNSSVVFSGTFGSLTFNGTTDTLDIVATPSAGGGGAWSVIVTVGADQTGAPGDVEEIPCTDAGRAILAAADDAAQRTALGLGSLATASGVTASQISDATTAGRSMLTAASATAQAELLAASIASWGRGLVHNTSVPPSGSWTPDSYTSTTGVVSFETGGQYQIHGLTGGTDGRIVVIYCATLSGLGLNHEDGAATAADRFYSPACSIQAGQAAILRYSGALSRWVTIAAPAIYPASGGPNFAEFQLNYFGSAFAASPGVYGSTLIILDAYDTSQFGAIQLAARIQQKLGTTTASANDLTLPGHNTAVNGSSSSSGGGNTHTISGTTQINRLDASGWQAGSKVTLIFSGSLTVAHKGASASGTLYPISLRYGASMLTTAGDTLDLVFDGALWQETGRRAA